MQFKAYWIHSRSVSKDNVKAKTDDDCYGINGSQYSSESNHWNYSSVDDHDWSAIWRRTICSNTITILFSEYPHLATHWTCSVMWGCHWILKLLSLALQFNHKYHILIRSWFQHYSLSFWYWCTSTVEASLSPSLNFTWRCTWVQTQSDSLVPSLLNWPHCSLRSPLRSCSSSPCSVGCC